MRQIGSNTLTQGDLVVELHRLGRTKITVRMVADWRRKYNLLPGFDRFGRGLGRAAGRGQNLWVNGDDVLAQAVWIYDLRKMKIFKKYDDLHLLLFLLGYPVPTKPVRKSLKKPLVVLTEFIKRKINGREDVGVGDIIDDMIGIRRLCGMANIDAEAIGALLNLILNSDFRLEDLPDEYSDVNICRFAAFIKQHLSLQQMKQAVEASTDADLMVVRRDIELLKESVLLLDRMIQFLCPDVPDDRIGRLKEMALPSLFLLGGLCALADISLRQNGHSECVESRFIGPLHHFRAGLERVLSRAISRSNEGLS